MLFRSIGFLAQVCFIHALIITVVVLVTSVVGIPILLLLPFAFLAAAVVGLVGFASVAHLVGGYVTRQLGWSAPGACTQALVGVVVVMLPVLLSRLASLGGGILFPFAVALGVLGFLVEYVAWTIGFGAVALARVKGRTLTASMTMSTPGA